MAEIQDLDVTDASNTARFPEGQAMNTLNDGSRALEGMLARHFKDTTDGAITTTGTSTAYAAASNKTLSAYHDGLTLCVQWHTDCGDNPTITVDSVGTKSLYFNDGHQVKTGQLKSGYRSLIQYDGTNFQVLNSSPLLADTVSMGDDTAVSFTPPDEVCVIEFCSPNMNANGTVAMRPNSTSSTVRLKEGGSLFAATTGALTGTTGTDVRLTVSAHTDGKIYMENRLGGTSAISYRMIISAAPS